MSPSVKNGSDKLLCFFLAPITAFFLPKVYRDAVKASWRTGACFIAYGALLFTMLVMAIFLERASTSDKFIHWVKENTPVVIWTPKGLSLENGQKTARLIHPIFGPMVAFDMDRDAVTKEDIGQYLLFVTSKRIVFQKPFAALEDRDVTKTTLRTNQSLPAKVRVTGELIESFYQGGKLTFLATTPVVVLPIVFLALLIVNGIFTLEGLLINQMRSQKLKLGEIFNLACFSSGTSLAVMALIMIGFVFSGQPPMWLIPASLLVSLLYMTAAIIFVDKQAAPLS